MKERTMPRYRGPLKTLAKPASRTQLPSPLGSNAPGTGAIEDCITALDWRDDGGPKSDKRSDSQRTVSKHKALGYSGVEDEDDCPLLPQLQHSKNKEHPRHKSKPNVPTVVKSRGGLHKPSSPRVSGQKQRPPSLATPRSHRLGGNTATKNSGSPGACTPSPVDGIPKIVSDVLPPVSVRQEFVEPKLGRSAQIVHSILSKRPLSPKSSCNDERTPKIPRFDDAKHVHERQLLPSPPREAEEDLRTKIASLEVEKNRLNKENLMLRARLESQTSLGSLPGVPSMESRWEKSINQALRRNWDLQVQVLKDQLQVLDGVVNLKNSDSGHNDGSALNRIKGDVAHLIGEDDQSPSGGWVRAEVLAATMRQLLTELVTKEIPAIMEDLRRDFKHAESRLVDEAQKRCEAEGRVEELTQEFQSRSEAGRTTLEALEAQCASLRDHAGKADHSAQKAQTKIVQLEDQQAVTVKDNQDLQRSVEEKNRTISNLKSELEGELEAQTKQGQRIMGIENEKRALLQKLDHANNQQSHTLEEKKLLQTELDAVKVKAEEAGRDRDTFLAQVTGFEDKIRSLEVQLRDKTFQAGENLKTAEKSETKLKAREKASSQAAEAAAKESSLLKGRLAAGEARNTQLTAENTAARAENMAFRANIAKVEKENQVLKNENKAQGDKIQNLTDQLAKNLAFRANLAEVQKENQVLMNANKAQDDKLQNLRGQLTKEEAIWKEKMKSQREEFTKKEKETAEVHERNKRLRGSRQALEDSFAKRLAEQDTKHQSAIQALKEASEQTKRTLSEEFSGQLGKVRAEHQESQAQLKEQLHSTRASWQEMTKALESKHGSDLRGMQKKLNLESGEVLKLRERIRELGQELGEAKSFPKDLEERLTTINNKVLASLVNVELEKKGINDHLDSLQLQHKKLEEEFGPLKKSRAEMFDHLSNTVEKELSQLRVESEELREKNEELHKSTKELSVSHEVQKKELLDFHETEKKEFLASHEQEMARRATELEASQQARADLSTRFNNAVVVANGFYRALQSICLPGQQGGEPDIDTEIRSLMGLGPRSLPAAPVASPNVGRDKKRLPEDKLTLSS